MEGILRERKKPVVCFQIVESDDQCKLVQKLTNLKNQAKQHLESRSKKLSLRQKHLDSELEQRKNTKELEQKIEELQSKLQELEKLHEAENLSTSEVLEAMDVKVGVAMSETQRWIDNSFLLVQSIIDQSQSTD